MALDALAGASAYTLAVLLRFVDEPGLPATYAQRLVPWAVLAAVLQIGVGEIMSRLRRPTSLLGRRRRDMISPTPIWSTAARTAQGPRRWA